MQTFTLSNPAVMGKFNKDVKAKSATKAAKQFASALFNHVHNKNGINLLISFYNQEAGEEHTDGAYHFNCAMDSNDNGSTIKVVKYTIPTKSTKAGSWGTALDEPANLQGGSGEKFSDKWRKEHGFDKKKKHKKNGEE